MNFKGKWTVFAVDAEYEHFGASRIVQAHNDTVAAERARCAEIVRAEITANHNEVVGLRRTTDETLHRVLRKIEQTERDR
jgi:low affinity Fe/Cu permease